VAVPWRYQARCPCPFCRLRGFRVFDTGSCEPTTTVSGLSSRPDCSGPAITRPVRHPYYSLEFEANPSSLLVNRNPPPP
jgi:hypothetical protein